MKDDKHIFAFPGDISKLIIPFPVCQETGNGIIFTYSWRKIAKTRNGSWKAYLWSSRGYVEMNNSISCLPGNRKLDYFCLFLKKNSRDKKMEADKHIFVFPGDILKWIIPFPVCQKTGNKIIFTYSQRNRAFYKKIKVDKHIKMNPGDISKLIIPFPVCQ